MGTYLKWIYQYIPTVESDDVKVQFYQIINYGKNMLFHMKWWHESGDWRFKCKTRIIQRGYQKAYPTTGNYNRQRAINFAVS